MTESGIEDFKPSGVPHSEKRLGYKFAVGHEKKGSSVPIPGSKEFAEQEKKKQRLQTMLIVGGGATALATAAGIGTGLFDKAGDEISDATKSTISMVENAVDTITVPIDKAIDLAGKIIPDDEPDRARIPNRILVGDVEIKTSNELQLRRNPQVTGKAESPNEIDWEDAKLANKKIVNNQVVYEPIEFKEGDTLIVRNPELVSGQYTGGGNGIGKEKDWIQLYLTDGSPVYINFQSETYGHVNEMKDPTKDSEYINATKLQDANGVRIVRYDSPLPENTSSVSVLPSNN